MEPWLSFHRETHVSSELSGKLANQRRALTVLPICGINSSIASSFLTPIPQPQFSQTTQHSLQSKLYPKTTVTMGNGAKAQQKRERNAKDAKGGASSQLKTVRYSPLTTHISLLHLSLLRATPPGLIRRLLINPVQNAAAKNIICKVCRQDFQCTVKRPQLEVHATDKHDKTYEDCFAA